MGKKKETVESNMLDNMLEGFENNESAVNEVVDFTNINFLRENNPIFPEEHTSKKYNPTREPKVTLGLKAVEKLLPELSPNFILMCKWWENKTARTEIKKVLDAEAEAKGIDPVVYLQDTIKKDVDLLASIREAIDRMAYAVTYFKPRGGIKDTYKIMRIRGELYNVNLRVLGELQAEYAGDKEALLDAAEEAFNKVEAMEEL
ncbi:MAG: hypothetical protein K2M17_02805 [Bacilli bacterium]|nr:hypothetical protein [Bacilli bacterium]